MRRRKRADEEKKKRLDRKAKLKLQQGRQKKQSEALKRSGGVSVLMPEVFASCNMKQQRNYVHYKRNKNKLARAAGLPVTQVQSFALAPEQRVPVDVLLCCLRVREARNATPQAQKILMELGLKELNNCSFVMSTLDNLKKLLMVADYIAYGQPTKATLENVIRKRGFLKTKEGNRVPISDNALIEDLLGASGIICVEDIIDSLWACKKSVAAYEAVRGSLWPIQLAGLKDTIEGGSVKHEATGKLHRKTITQAKKGGYVGMMPKDELNTLVERLI